MSETDKEQLTLGQISVNNDAFELDLKINEGYQAYSAELLRLALLVLPGLAIAWLRLYLPDSGTSHPLVFPANLFFFAAFLGAAFSAGAALLHRYTAADSLAYHLTALRRRVRNRPAIPSRPSDVELAEDQERKRDVRFSWSGHLLRISAILLFIGLMLFCLSVATFMF